MTLPPQLIENCLSGPKPDVPPLHQGGEAKPPTIPTMDPTKIEFA